MGQHFRTTDQILSLAADYGSEMQQFHLQWGTLPSDKLDSNGGNHAVTGVQSENYIGYPVKR